MQPDIFLAAVIQRMQEQKILAEKTFGQLTEYDLHLKLNEGTNTIAIIIQHIAGNMHSRWTDFLTEDGEKHWRNRDKEFEEVLQTKDGLLSIWTEGWKVFLSALQSLQPHDLDKTIYIRSQPLAVIDAIIRQVAHYSHHTGQIVLMGKIIKGPAFKSLSIPHGASQKFNQQLGHI